MAQWAQMLADKNKAVLQGGAGPRTLTNGQQPAPADNDPRPTVPMYMGVRDANDAVPATFGSRDVPNSTGVEAQYKDLIGTRSATDKASAALDAWEARHPDAPSRNNNYRGGLSQAQTQGDGSYTDAAGQVHGPKPNYDTPWGRSPAGQVQHDAQLAGLSPQELGNVQSQFSENYRNRNTVNAQNYGTDIGFRGRMAQLAYDQKRLGIQLGQEGSKMRDEDLKNDPYNFEKDPKGGPDVYSPERASRLSQYIDSSSATVKVNGQEMPLNMAYALGGDTARAARQQASDDLRLWDHANEQGKGAWGKGMSPGKLKLGAIRPINPVSDYVGGNIGLWDAAKTNVSKPLWGGNVLPIADASGREVPVPMHSLTPEALEAVNRRLVREQKTPVDVWGNPVKQ